MNPLSHEIEAPKEKNAFTRILSDMVSRNNANTKGGNQVENIHDDIDSFLQLYYLPPHLSTTAAFSASFLLLSTSHCYEIAINSAVPGVDLITSSGWPKSFGCYYSIPLPSLSFHSGTRQTPTTVPHSHVPLHCTTPGALHLPIPPLPLHAAFHLRATCLP